MRLGWIAALRLPLAIFLLGVAGYTGWLSTLLLDMSNFRTEGSPAGTVMFVVFLGFPVLSLASGIGGLLLLSTYWMRGSSVEEQQARRSTPRPAPKPPPRALRQLATDGSTLELLENDGLAVLWWRATDGSGRRSDNGRRASNDTYCPFRSVDGQPVRLPRGWTVTVALAQAAFDEFRNGGDWTARLRTQPTPIVPPALLAGVDRDRWDWLVRHTN